MVPGEDAMEIEAAATEPEEESEVESAIGSELPDEEGESDDDEEGIVGEEEEESEVLVVDGVPLDTSCMTINEAYSIYPF